MFKKKSQELVIILSAALAGYENKTKRFSVGTFDGRHNR